MSEKFDINSIDGYDKLDSEEKIRELADNLYELLVNDFKGPGIMLNMIRKKIRSWPDKDKEILTQRIYTNFNLDAQIQPDKNKKKFNDILDLLSGLAEFGLDL